MCVEDLNDSDDGVPKVMAIHAARQDTAEGGFNFDDSSDCEQLAALPSIQNEYTLQIKSIYQYKKPYL